jgi:CubicO group peptidase (beta-lactamase class C family)
MKALVCLLLMSLAPQPPDQPVAGGALGRRIDELVSRIAATGFGGQVLAEKDGRVVLHKAYGLADRAAGTPATLETRFGIASMSKQFAGAAILRLEEEGRLSTSDPISKYVDGVPEDKRAITIHQVLTHTAGLPGGFADNFSAPTREAAIERILSKPLVGPVGGPWRYASEAYALVAAVVDRAAGMPYEEYLRARFFEPAGMARTGFANDGAARGPVSHAYVGWTDNGSPAAWPKDYGWRASGDVVSTAGDLYRWEQALRAGRILGAASVARLFAPHAVLPEGGAYGYGAFVGKRPNGKTFTEQGGDTELGFNGVVFRYVDERALIVIVSNARDARGTSMRHAIQADIEELLVDGADVAPPPAMRRPTADEALDWAGRVEAGPAGRLRLAFDGAHLWLAAEGQGLVDALTAPEDAAGTALATARTRELVDRLLAHDVAAYRAALGAEGLPYAEEYEQEWRDLVRANGQLHGFDALGSREQGPATVAFVRLRFRTRTLTMSFRWLERGRGRLAGTNPAAVDSPVLLPVAVSAPGALVVYDPTRGGAKATLGGGRGRRELTIRAGSAPALKGRYTPVDLP